MWVGRQALEIKISKLKKVKKIKRTLLLHTCMITTKTVIAELLFPVFRRFTPIIEKWSTVHFKKVLPTQSGQYFLPETARPSLVVARFLVENLGAKLGKNAYVLVKLTHGLKGPGPYTQMTLVFWNWQYFKWVLICKWQLLNCQDNLVIRVWVFVLRMTLVLFFSK